MKKLACFTIVMLLTACGSSTVTKQALSINESAKVYSIGKVSISAKEETPPDHFATAVSSYLKKSLTEKHAYNTKANSVDINITSYRMRSGFTRMAFGVFAGKDGVESEVTVYDQKGNVIGKSTVSTYNRAAIGDMEDIARMHANAIADFLTKKEEAAQRGNSQQYSAN